MRQIRKAGLKFAVVFMLLSAVPVIVAGGIFLQLQYNESTENITAGMQQRAQMVSAVFDRMIDNIESVASHFSALYQEESTIDAHKLEKQFSTYVDTFALQGSLYYYSRSDQLMYGIDGAIRYGEFTATQPFGHKLSMISLYQKLNAKTSAVYLDTLETEGTDNYMICVYPVPQLSTSPEGALVYIMDHLSIESMISNVIGDESGYYAVFDAGHCLTYLMSGCDRHSLNEVKAAISPLKGTHAMEHLIGDERFVSFRILSEKRGFSYLLSVPYDELYAGVEQKLTGYGTALGLFVLVAVLCALLAAWWQTRPIYHLAESVDIEANDWEEDEQADLFSAVAQRFHSIQNENEQLLLQMRSYADRSRNRLLNELVHGVIHTQDALDEAMKTAGLVFNYPLFFVITMVIRNGTGDSDAETLLQLLSEVDFRQGKAYAFATDQPNRLGILINTAEASGEDTDSLRRRSADSFMERIAKLGFHSDACGVSRIQRNALRINQQLCEAIAALSWSDNGVGLYSRDHMMEQQFPFHECEMFRQSLLLGDAESAEKTLQRLTGRAAAEHWATDRSQAVFFRLVNILLSAYTANHCFLDSTGLTLAASGAQPEQVEAVLHEPIQELCTTILNQKVNAEHRINQAVIDYIYQHYREADISAETLMERFKLSEVTLRRIIRDMTGTTLLSYITTLRLAYVKKELSETDRTIKDIVESAGYIDLSSFSRKFKSIEGVTPGQYRSATQAITHQ